MREGLVEGLVQGDRGPWAVIAVVWLITAALVAFRREDLGISRVVALFGATVATSLAALPLSAALAIPRMRWRPASAPELVSPSGETWRRLRGPAVAVGDDVAVPTTDAQGRWVLMGLLSGRAVPGLAPAPPGPAPARAPRLCRGERDECRPWPASWPDPGAAIGHGELVWSHDVSPLARAFDPEAGLFLEVDPAATTLELLGRVAAEPRRDEPSALFVVRRVSGGRLRGARLVAIPVATGFTFQLQRVDVALEAGPAALRWFARPLLALTLLSVPVGAAWMALRRRAGAAALAAGGSAATLAAGLAAAAPAVVAIVSLLASR